MNFELVALLAAAFVGFGLVSRSAEERGLTGPMFFTLVGGALFAFGVPGMDPAGESEHGLGTPEWVHTLAEIALALVLFVDASKVRFGELWSDRAWILRLLGVALPLTLVLGTLGALLLCSILTPIEAALVAAMLTPTDAALGLAVVNHPGVPERIRRTLSVESGLNDGIVLPAVVGLAAVAAAQAGFLHEAAEGGAGWLGFLLAQAGGGPLIGLAIGGVGGALVERYGARRETMSESFERLAAPALAWLSFATAESLGANGFLAAFVGGLATGATAATCRERLQEFGEAAGELLALLTFAAFGAFLVPPLFEDFNASRFGLALFALTVMRMGPVLLAMVGSEADARTRWFLAWFGPRGIASILFLLVIGREVAHPGAVAQVVSWTVLFSVFAHGATAGPLARRYARAAG